MPETLPKYNAPALQELQDRGFIYQGSDMTALDQALSAGPLTFYIGYDATASSLHVGSLLTMMAMRILQKHGSTPLVLMGGGTTKVGDPTGKDKSRLMLNDAQISENIASIQRSFAQFIRFEGGDNHAVMLNNDDWLSRLNYLEFLRDYGPHFTINRMLTFESVKRRLERETPMTFLEFNYMLLQAYDFHELYKTHNCRLQLGGSDQWGNILNGVELVRRLDNTQAFGLTIPLITTASGGKMGKTAQGAVWLNPDMLSSYDYWQFWRNTEDQDVVRFMKYFTDMPLSEIAPYAATEGAGLNEGKRRLADEATALLHGKDALPGIHTTIQRLFDNKEQPLECTGTDDHGNAILSAAVPILEMPLARLDDGIAIIELLREANLAASNGDARRLIRGGGCRLNDEKVTDEALHVQHTHLQDHKTLKLAAGKKKFAYIQFLKS